MDEQTEQGYAVQLPKFWPDPWPDRATLEVLTEQEALGQNWETLIANFKSSHHLENGEWVANA